MNIIRNLKIRDKLLILLSLLLLPLIYFVGTTIGQEIEELKKLKQEAVQLEESEKISALIHAFQKERARILVAASGDTVFMAEALAIRNVTDAEDRNLKVFMEKAGRLFPELAMLNELKKYRYDLDHGRLDINEFRQFANNLILSFLGRIDANAIGVSNIEVAERLLSSKHLVTAKVQLARIRSLLIMAIQNGQFSYQDYAQIKIQIDLYNRALNDFSKYAQTESLEEVQAITNSDNYKKVAIILHAIEQDPSINFRSLNVTATFNLFTRSIEDYRKAEKLLTNSIRNQVNEGIRRKQQTLTILIFAIAGILILTGTLSIYIINLIAVSLSKLKIAADRIKQGATDVVIDVYSKDEIGSVASSFRGVVNKTVMLSEVAQAIGKGQYDVEVEVQGNEDVLSAAIRDMKDNLQTYSTDNANQSWVLGGMAELNTLLSGEDSIDKVAENTIAFLCNYTASYTGILYLHNSSGKLEPAAGYGVQHSREQLPAFTIGSGIVGQAVKERKVKVLEDVPEEYMKIQTGLADIDPVSVIILPLYLGNTIVGAMELGARHAYTPVHQQFFNAAAERVTVVLHTLQTHLHTQELLAETQNLAEELETQQEELRQLNAELTASEEELQEKNTELEEKAELLEEQFETLHIKNKALEDARDAIELKIKQVEAVSKYKSDFLANMSHELRTPLNSILILSRLLADNVENTLSTKQKDHAQIIHKSGNDLLRLINEILDLSKIESGAIRIETDEIKLEEITLEPMFREMAARKKIRYKEHYTPGSFDSIVTDRFRLEQILKNFIGNAIKFTGEGGEVELSVYPVTHRPAFKTEHLREQPDVIAFSVRDTGIGISEEKQDVVFEAFQQADTSTTRKYGGTGLGLTISKELATLLGGEIILESEAGKGSTFTLYLPHVPFAAEEKQQDVKSAPAIASRAESRMEGFSQVFRGMEQKEKKDLSVLIVEDDKCFSDILADFAVSKNFKVHQAFTGADGLRLAHEEKPYAMLLDINLPDMSGWDVLRQVREAKDLRHINVHVMSAYDKEVIGEHAENEEYLPKPVTLEMLNKAFTTIAESSGASIENILIVEDNGIENKAIAELLLAHGLKSTSALSAEEAEHVLSKHKVDCIILDLNLPGMKGYDWMKKIKSVSGLADIPIIIYSGKDLSEDEEKALKEFANTIIIKNEYSYLRLLDEVQLFLHKVNQKLPEGSEFKMKLHVPEEVLQGKNVLVVDDDVRNIYSLSSLLEQHGMEVSVVYNGKEALRQLESGNKADIVLMDVMMPEMDGIETTKRIRANARFKQLPIIALTAKAMKEDREKCLKAGASDYITKPVDTDKLLALMRVWLYEA